MGDMNSKPTENQQSDRQSGKRTNLDDLPETFRKHYAQVSVFKDVTSAQETLVDELLHIVSESSNENDKKMKRKVDILKDLQSARSKQCELLYQSVRALHSNVTSILADHNKPTFTINSNDQDNSSKKINLKHLAQAFFPQNKDLKEQVKKPEETVKLLQSPQKETGQQKLSNQQKLSKLGPPGGIGSVQLYHSHSGKTIHEIEVSLEEMLNVHFNQVKLMKSHKLDDVDPSKALVILSITTTRVGTDAKHALEGIKNPANTALVLIHIKEEHALPRQDSSAILTDEKFKALGGIFDLAFMHGKGIYQCEMNDAALGRIHSFIKQNTKCNNYDTVSESVEKTTNFLSF